MLRVSVKTHRHGHGGHVHRQTAQPEWSGNQPPPIFSGARVPIDTAAMYGVHSTALDFVLLREALHSYCLTQQKKTIFTSIHVLQCAVPRECCPFIHYM